MREIRGKFSGILEEFRKGIEGKLYGGIKRAIMWAIIRDGIGVTF
jgi:hypothetical protein